MIKEKTHYEERNRNIEVKISCYKIGETVINTEQNNIGKLTLTKFSYVYVVG